MTIKITQFIWWTEYEFDLFPAVILSMKLFSYVYLQTTDK